MDEITEIVRRACLDESTLEIMPEDFYTCMTKKTFPSALGEPLLNCLSLHFFFWSLWTLHFGILALRFFMQGFL